jgi:hypothetical protein
VRSYSRVDTTSPPTSNRREFARRVVGALSGMGGLQFCSLMRVAGFRRFDNLTALSLIKNFQ